MKTIISLSSLTHTSSIPGVVYIHKPSLLELTRFTTDQTLWLCNIITLWRMK